MCKAFFDDATIKTASELRKSVFFFSRRSGGLFFPFSFFFERKLSPSLLPSPSAMICPCVKRGHTPLHWAAMCGYDKCVQVLIEAGADLKAKDDVREEGGYHVLQCRGR